MDINKLLRTAIDAALESGRILCKEGGSSIDSESGHDIKLKADKESEARIFAKLEQTGINILSEEYGVNTKNNEDLWWIVDPLDGSLNYQRHIPICCISIALWKANKPLLGVVYDFNHDKLYSGIVGEGASVNGKPIFVSDIPEREKAIIATGFPVYLNFDDRVLSTFVKTLQKYKKVRLFGSAALSCMSVAQGSVEVYSESNIALWDVAAGIAVIEAAGGCCDYEYTNKEKFLLNVFAANGKITK